MKKNSITIASTNWFLWIPTISVALSLEGDLLLDLNFQKNTRGTFSAPTMWISLKKVLVISLGIAVEAKNKEAEWFLLENESDDAVSEGHQKNYSEWNKILEGIDGKII